MAYFAPCMLASLTPACVIGFACYTGLERNAHEHAETFETVGSTGASTVREHGANRDSGGKLILCELYNPGVARVEFAFGLLPGWWLSEIAPLIPQGLYLSCSRH